VAGKDGRVYGVGTLNAIGATILEDMDLDDEDGVGSTGEYWHRCAHLLEPVSRSDFRVWVPQLSHA
jgi:hypothetical protein